VAASKLKVFYIMGKIVADVHLPIKAMSLEDALDSAGGMKIDDFADIKGDVCDGSLAIKGVFAAEDN
jgi:hypothetical protein